MITNINSIKKLIERTDLKEIIPENINNWEITNNASFLSHGQRQRIFILKAIWRNPKILIMDEPTSAMDDKTENIYIQMILNNLKNSTVITVSHSNNFTNNNFELINL